MAVSIASKEAASGRLKHRACGGPSQRGASMVGGFIAACRCRLSLPLRLLQCRAAKQETFFLFGPARKNRKNPST